MLWYMSLYEEAMMKELNIVQDLLTNKKYVIFTRGLR